MRMLIVVVSCKMVLDKLIPSLFILAFPRACAFVVFAYYTNNGARYMKYRIAFPIMGKFCFKFLFSLIS